MRIYDYSKMCGSEVMCSLKICIPTGLSIANLRYVITLNF